jgi:Flp pilus assembly pilin Flp
MRGRPEQAMLALRRGLSGAQSPASRVVNYQMTTLSAWLASTRNDDGQGLAEYALILALIAIIAIAALIFLGTQISTILSTIGAKI